MFQSYVRRPLVALCLFSLLTGPLTPLHAQSRVALPQLGDPDADDLSPAAERRLGELSMREIRRDPAYLNDAELHDYLSQFASKLANTAPAQRARVETFWVKDASLNAFAMPGGFIGIHTGLMLAAQSESELAAVMGHEIGHVVQRHLARMLAQQKQASFASLAGLVLAALAARAGNYDGAVGLATLGSSVALQQQLAFSRDAEREADRLGLEIARDAGYNPKGMVDFFQRLQLAGRAYENNAPVYLRTHPLNTERIGDVQTRLLNERYRQLPSSLEFELVKARLRIDQDRGAESIANAIKWFERAQQEGRLEAAPAQFGLAHAHIARRDWAAAASAIARTRQALAKGSALGSHPFLERLEAQLALGSGDASKAQSIASAGLKRFPGSRALAQITAEAALAGGQIAFAVSFLNERVLTTPSDDLAWQLLGDAHDKAGQRQQSLYAYSQALALRQQWPAALAQLQLAQRPSSADFVLASLIDTKAREYQGRIEQEKREAKELGRR
jgi:beta-barrel assembly-enhancing protease